MTKRVLRGRCAGTGALVLAGVAGCTTWRAHPDVSRAVAEKHGRALRVTTGPRSTYPPGAASTGETVLLRHARVAGDSVVGESGGQWLRAAPHRRAIAVAEIREVATREVDVGRTARRVGAAVGVTAVLAAVAYYLTYARVGY